MGSSATQNEWEREHLDSDVIVLGARYVCGKTLPGRSPDHKFYKALQAKPKSCKNKNFRMVWRGIVMKHALVAADQLAQFVCALKPAFCTARAHLIAHSHGGKTWFLYALKEPAFRRPRWDRYPLWVLHFLRLGSGTSVAGCASLRQPMGLAGYFPRLVLSYDALGEGGL